jgi:2-C-methyl-D-erythritol 4-phosphate cytidylyltransferase/2-C-methyl-D-erythritol 2,4-cyclodiphosphate synthase
LTTPEDVRAAQAMLASELRVGQGYDAHRLAEGRKLVLCGVEIPYEKGLLGHSDADVAAHALMDALLGAAALDDIGRHFPDSDPAYRGADSMALMARVARILKERGWYARNVDVTIIAEAPKLMPYRERMRENIARALAIPVERVSVKATTTERLGYEGRGEGMSASAVAAITK